MAEIQIQIQKSLHHRVLVSDKRGHLSHLFYLRNFILNAIISLFFSFFFFAKIKGCLNFYLCLVDTLLSYDS